MGFPPTGFQVLIKSPQMPRKTGYPRQRFPPDSGFADFLILLPMRATELLS